MQVQNAGAGSVTITPNVSGIDGAASLALPPNSGVLLVSGGGQYYTERGQAGGGTGGSGSVQTAEAGQLAYYPASGTAVSGSGCILSGLANADLTCGSFRTSGLTQGEVDLYPSAGSATYIGIAAPSSTPATYTMQLPPAAPANQVLSFGAPFNGTAYGSWVNAIVVVGIGPVASIPYASSFGGSYYIATDSTDCATGGGSTNTLCRSTGSAWVPLGGGSAGGGAGVAGGVNLTYTGAVPFQNGTAGTVTQDTGFTYNVVSHRLTTGDGADPVTTGTWTTGYSGLWAEVTSPSITNYTLLGDGTNTYFNAPSGGLMFRVGNSDIMKVVPGTTTLQIPALASHSGTRYVCVDTSGNLLSQVTPCSGT